MTTRWIAAACFTLGALIVSAPRAGAADPVQDRKFTRTFTVAPGGRLHAVLSTGDIRVTTWQKNEVSLSIDGLTSEDAKTVTAELRGSTVEVEVDLGHWSSGDVRLDATVPSKFDLDLLTNGGDLAVLGPQSGVLHGATMGGDIRLGALAGTIEMNTMGGDIHADPLQGSVRLATSGGDVAVKAVQGTGLLRTSGGSISIGDVTENLDVSTSGGDILVGDIGGRLNATTAGGDVAAGRVGGEAKIATAGGDITLRGGTGTVQVTTAGGDIVLADATGKIDCTTSGGDIRATLAPGISAHSRFTTAAGDIHLYVPDGLQITIEARIKQRRGGWEDDDDEFTVTSDFPVENRERSPRTGEVRATIQVNGGGNLVSVNTAAGNIEVRKGRAPVKGK
jgi:DUF4097 and DUF4098 domain-containing protein YvlB